MRARPGGPRLVAAAVWAVMAVGGWLTVHAAWTALKELIGG